MPVLRNINGISYALNMSGNVQDAINSYKGRDNGQATTAGTEDEDAYHAAQASYGVEASRKKLIEKGYVEDSELSNDRHKVYAHKDKNTLVGYRGTRTSDGQDLVDDINLAIGNRKTKGFKDATEIAQKAKTKYGKDLVHAGHSLGGTKALEAQKSTGGRTVAFNPGQSIFGEKTDQRVYVNRNDIISSRIRGKNTRATKKQRKGVFGSHDLSQFE